MRSERKKRIKIKNILHMLIIQSRNGNAAFLLTQSPSHNEYFAAADAKSSPVSF